MAEAPPQRMTYALDDASEVKHEYLRGEVYAMATAHRPSPRSRRPSSPR